MQKNNILESENILNMGTSLCYYNIIIKIKYDSACFFFYVMVLHISSFKLVHLPSGNGNASNVKIWQFLVDGIV